ncbi:MAG: MBL fold metallo-hydrolase [Candidatus Hodarchaeota archaeon]
MRVEVLGSSSFVPTLKSSWSSFFVELGDDETILIDAGTRRLLGFRRDLLNVNHIFITHRHLDHIIFLGALLRRMKRNHRTTPLTVFCPVNAFYQLKTFIRFYLPSGSPNFVSFQPFTPSNPKHLVTLSHTQTQIWTAATCHTTMAAAFALVQGSKKIVFAPDTAPNCSTLLALAKGAQGFFHDCTFPTRVHTLAVAKGHSSPEGAGLDATKAEVESLILIHTSRVRALNQQTLIAGAAQHFKGKIHVAKDGSNFTF